MRTSLQPNLILAKITKVQILLEPKYLTKERLKVNINLRAAYLSQ